MVDRPEQIGGLRRGVFGAPALVFGMLALWSSWNPGYHYLTRAAGFIVLGAGAIFLWMRRRNGRYAVAVACLYVTAILAIGVHLEWITAPANQTESINIWLAPLLVVFMLATAVAALLRPRRTTDPAQ
jgi:asparagine N-glycosylation enzyme membrane subunit Stt3